MPTMLSDRKRTTASSAPIGEARSYNHWSRQNQETSAGPKLRAGFRLEPEMGAACQYMNATRSQVIKGVQRIRRWLLTKRKIARTSRQGSPISIRKTLQMGYRTPAAVTPFWPLPARSLPPDELPLPHPT